MKYFTFNITCSFNMQFTFTNLEVEQDPEGNKGEFQPTEKVIESLTNELQEYLGQHYSVEQLEVYADSNDLLGIE